MAAFFKWCPRCELFKVRNQDFSRCGNSIQSYCKTCRNSLNREIVEDPKQYKKLLQRNRESKRRLRLETIEAYGGKCACCGEKRWEFLTIDHKYNDGCKERKTLTSESSMYRMLKKRGFPKDRYQCLCYNCNCAKSALGYCPHQKEKRR